MRIAKNIRHLLLFGALAIVGLAIACSSAPASDTGSTPVEPADQSMVKVPAPIEGVEILVLTTFPAEYLLVVKSGLPNGCVEFDSYDVTREGDTIRVRVTNVEPANRDTPCTEEYRTVVTNIPLGSDLDFDPGKYTVLVNDVTETFVTGGSPRDLDQIAATLDSPFQLRVGQTALIEP